MDGKSLDITADILAQLKAILPNVFSEDKIDFQRLKQALGEDVFVKGEHYELNWAGKTEARKEIQKQTTATLVPNRAESVDFDKARHIFIEGENLEVLRTLQKSYFGKVKMIYIDPPYNTGSDSFVYPDDYTERQDEYKKRTGITTDEGYLNKSDLWKKNVKENGQFHSVWMSMMYPRLYLSRNLLREDGVIFISIDDNEQANLKLMCDEIFGAENFVTIICHKSRASVSNDKIISQNHNHILLYSKNLQLIFDNRTQFGLEPDLENFNLEDEKDKYKLVPVSAPGGSKKGNPFFEFLGIENYYRFSKETMQDMYKKGLLVKSGDTIQQKYYLEKAKQTRKTDTTWWDEKFYTSTATLKLNTMLGGDYFTNPKPTELIKKMLELVNDKQALILDFFAGSGTTAQAVMELNEEDGGNRRFICVQMPEKIEEGSEAYKVGYKTIADITQARIKKVIEKLQTERAAKAEKENGELFNGEKDTSLYPLGFQSYQLAMSNFKQWNKHVTGEEALLEQLDIFQQAEIESSLPENMLYELLVKGGFDLTTPVEPLQCNGSTTLYNVDNGKLWVLFDKYTPSVKAAVVAAKPERLIVLDSCFDGDDVAITNLQLDLRENGIDLTII